MLTGKTIVTAVLGSLIFTLMAGNAEAKGDVER